MFIHPNWSETEEAIYHDARNEHTRVVVYPKVEYKNKPLFKFSNLITPSNVNRTAKLIIERVYRCAGINFDR